MCVESMAVVNIENRPDLRSPSDAGVDDRAEWNVQDNHYDMFRVNAHPRAHGHAHVESEKGGERPEAEGCGPHHEHEEKLSGEWRLRQSNHPLEASIKKEHLLIPRTNALPDPCVISRLNHRRSGLKRHMKHLQGQ